MTASFAGEMKGTLDTEGTSECGSENNTYKIWNTKTCSKYKRWWRSDSYHAYES